MEIINFIADNILWIILAVVVLFIFIGALIANISYDNHMQRFEKYKKIPTSFAGSALDLAKLFSTTFFNGRIKVSFAPFNQLRSHGCYMGNGTVCVATEIVNSNSIATVGVIAHEFGHAEQHYHTKLLHNHAKFEKYVSRLGDINIALIILGIVLGFAISKIIAFVCLGLIVLNFIFAITLKYKTVQIEADASDRAIEMLRLTQRFNDENIKDVRKFLNSAKSTYVADFLASLLAWTGLVRKTKFFGNE